MRLCEQCGFEKDGVLCGTTTDCDNPRQPTTEALVGVLAYYPGRYDEPDHVARQDGNRVAWSGPCHWCGEHSDNLVPTDRKGMTSERVCRDCAPCTCEGWSELSHFEDCLKG